MHPWKLPRFIIEKNRALRKTMQSKADLWLTYHTYYKAPDLLGPGCAQQARIPYAIFQGIYSTKRRRRLKTVLGFHLNRRALRHANVVFTNKHRDHHNLSRIIAPQRLVIVRPGIRHHQFRFDAGARADLRQAWQTRRVPVLLTIAMLRPGVKTRGVEIVIRACKRLSDQGLPFKLLVGGDGAGRKGLEHLARQLIPNHVRFLGKIPRSELHRIYSAADVFVFPGIEESLGMVYLEAQSCGLPVVAFDAWGASEAVIHGLTGLLCGPSDLRSFDAHLTHLLTDKPYRQSLSRNAIKHIRDQHDLNRNYGIIENRLQAMVSGRSKN